MAELVDAGDSKSPAARCAGSSPASGTISFFLFINPNDNKLIIVITTYLESIFFYEAYSYYDGYISSFYLGFRLCSS